MKPPLLLLAAAALLAIAGPVAAQKKASDYTVEDFFRPGQFTEMRLSPNGERLSALAPLKGRNNLVILDLKTRKSSMLTNFEALDALEVTWVNNDRVCFRVADGQEATGQLLYRGTYCINHDGSDLRDFTRPGVRDATTTAGGLTLISFLARVYDGSPDMIVMAALRTRDSQDVYRFNTSTGRFQLLSFDSPGRVVRWILDHNHVPRVAVTQPKRDGRGARNVRQVWYRDGEGAKWEKLHEYGFLSVWSQGEAISPLAFDFDNTTLYVASNVGRERFAIYKYDTKARKMGELLFEDALVDMPSGLEAIPDEWRGLVFSRKQKKLLGVRYQADKPASQWVDPDAARLQRQVDATFPRTANLVSLPPENEARALIFSQSDVDPGTYYLMDRNKPSIEALVKTRDWLDPKLLSERRFITYKARDGRVIPAYLTIPAGSSGKNLPLIVNIHGGPWLRVYHWAEWMRPEAQFFASRGYAVLEPEPRGSTGFGRSHFESSFKQWGQAMQDDITDGALHLAKEGIVDKGRMCLHGGSYGGYASAMGVAKEPELWRCATPFVAVTDLFLFQKTSYSDLAALTNFFETDFLRMVGDSDADREMFTRYSPAQQAAKIKAPVLLTMGSDDVRVPQVHGDTFRSNLESAGKKVDYVVYPGEGHGYNKPGNVYDFYRRLEKFFAEHLK